MKRRTSTTNGIGSWTSGQLLLLGSRGTRIEARYELISVDIVTAMMLSIEDWTMWRGRPPPKRLKREPHAWNKKSRTSRNSGQEAREMVGEK
jgi:hypothetical protein